MEVFGQAVAASLVTSIVPALLLLVLPKGGVRPWVLRTMLAFAAGGLLGDVFLHMLPAMMSDHSHDHSHDHSYDHSHDHSHGHSHDHSRDHSHDHSRDHSHGDQTPMLLVLLGIIAFFALDGFMKAMSGDNHSHGHSHAAPVKKNQKKNGTKAWLNLVADTAHNFTDGFVIGVAFLTRPATAYHTTLLILVHEIPHELGDFAVLASCGWKLGEIFSFQLVTALGNLAGCVLVVLVGTQVDGFKYYIGPFAAGSFIYMALCSILSELNNPPVDIDDKKKNNTSMSPVTERMLHTAALCMGILSMYAVVWMEETLGVHAH